MEEKLILLDNKEQQNPEEGAASPQKEKPSFFKDFNFKDLDKKQIYIIAAVAALLVFIIVILLFSKLSATPPQQTQNPYQMGNSGMQNPQGQSADISVNGNHGQMEPTVNVPAIEDKEIVINVGDDGRANPFSPQYFQPSTSKISHIAKLKAASKINFDIIEPPETFSEDTPIKNLMNTKISGILYDSRNPSAIINISGQDYFVKKGDFINNYHILGITRDEVVVESQNNIYRARVGQILNNAGINQNKIYNLRHKFGGSYR